MIWSKSSGRNSRPNAKWPVYSLSSNRMTTCSDTPACLDRMYDFNSIQTFYLQMVTQ